MKLKKFSKTAKFIRVFTIDDLEYDAQQNAYYDWLQHAHYPWESDNWETLQAFCSWFPIGRVKYEYGPSQPPWITADINVPEDVNALRGLRLRTYILNNYEHVLFKPKYLRHIGGKPKHSRVTVVREPDMTGYYLDYIMCKPLYDFIDRPNKYDSLSDLLQECLWRWVDECHKDMEYFYSFENFKETAKEMGWLYNIHGRQVI